MQRIVAVIGGGPAGSAAATAAARMGARVVLFERSGPGRDKACGDALVKEAVPELRALGIDEAAKISGYNIAESTLRGADGKQWKKQHGGDCWLAPRKVLDQTLRDLAEARGAEVCYRSIVRRIVSVPEGGYELEYQSPLGVSGLRADAVVLAHGANCQLSSNLGIGGAPVKVPAVSRYQDGASPAGLCFIFEPDKYGPGYTWEFPVGADSVNVGIFSLARTDLRIAIGRYEVHAQSDVARWRGAYEPLWTGEGRRWTAAGDGIVSCGDAAGIVDPLTGEGIGPALVTGRVAGQAAAEFAFGSPESARSYSEWIYSWAEQKYDINTGRRRIRKQLNLTGFASES